MVSHPPGLRKTLGSTPSQSIEVIYMKLLHFVTKNKHKADEVKKILSEYNIKVKQLKIEKIEPKDFSVEQVAKTAAETAIPIRR